MPTPHPTLIGRIALVVSAVAATGVYGYVWILAYSDTTWSAGWATLRDIAFYPFEFGAGIGLPAAIVLNVFAGTRGRANQVLGIWGGVVLLLPIPLAFLGIMPTPF